MRIFLVALSFFTLNVYAQSYLIMENGITLTTDSDGYSYDFGHYAFPQKISLRGGQYFVEDGNILVTIDEKGLLYRKYELIPENIMGKGINYFLSNEGELYTIDRLGSVRIIKNELYKDAINFGGNYFTIPSNPEKTKIDLYVVTKDGTVIKAIAPRFGSKEIVSFGGTYFMTNKGVLFTVAHDGTVTLSNDFRIGLLSKRGGNYFIDSSGIFFTVTATGDLIIPDLPMNLRIGTILRFGSNYFIDQSGNFYVVGKDGQVFERVMTDHDFRLAKVISL